MKGRKQMIWFDMREFPPLVYGMMSHSAEPEAAEVVWVNIDIADG
jgi:hypothetical protein